MSFEHNYVGSYPSLKVSLKENFLSGEDADLLLSECNGLGWKPNTGNKRSNITFGDNGLVYAVKFKDTTLYRITQEWSKFPLLQKIKDKLESCMGEDVSYNCCAVMRYPHGGVVIKPHRDKEMVGGDIYGISVGSTRTLRFRPPRSYRCKNVDLSLSHGSMYCICRPTNDKWSHEILQDDSKRVRYSLTFRNVLHPLTIDDIPIYPKCTRLLASGVRKGTCCGCMIKNGGDYCGRHTRRTLEP